MVDIIPPHDTTCIDFLNKLCSNLVPKPNKYDYFTHKLKPHTNNYSSVGNSIFAGSIAGATSCIIFHPLDVLRTRIQISLSTNKYVYKKRPLALLTHIIRHGGIYAIYTGLSVPLAAQSCYKATIYTVNRLVREMIISSKQSLCYLDYFICGATAGAVNAFFFCYPSRIH